jgi:hypothetical protein
MSVSTLPASLPERVALALLSPCQGIFAPAALEPPGPFLSRIDHWVARRVSRLGVSGTDSIRDKGIHCRERENRQSVDRCLCGRD